MLPEHKKRLLIILVILLAFGFYLRSYHLDYPVIGYHNWKEVHYLSEARNFAEEGFFNNGFFVPEYDYPDILAQGDAQTGTHPDTFPLPQLIIALLFKLFWVSVPLARLVGILAGIASIPLAYSIGSKLFKMPLWGYVLATLATINPLFVFFSRNVQLDSIGLLLALLSTWYYLQWHETRTRKHLFLTMLFLSLATLTKYTFLIMAVPMITSYPWKEIYSKFKENKKEFIASLTKNHLVPSLPLILVPLWLFYEQIVLKGRLGGGIGTDFTYDFSVIFTPQFRASMNSFIADNYTLLGWYLALAGIVLFLFLYSTKKEKTFLDYYLLGAFIALPTYLIAAVNKLSGHNYHQYPIAMFILLFITYLAVVVGTTVKKQYKYGHIIIAGLLIGILFTPSMTSANRMFDTQFPGLEVAGEYIKAHSNTDEMIFFPSHQSYGVLWHADRKGLKTPPTLELFKQGETKYNVQWLYLYQWGLALVENKEVWPYVTNNYHLELVTFQLSGQQATPIGILLKRGGNYTDDDLNTLLQTGTPKTTTYEYTYGTQTLQTVTK